MSRLRAGRVLAGTVSGLFLLLLAGKVWLSIQQAADAGILGFDYGVHVEIARRWLSTGELYAPSQLAAPYTNSPTYTPTGVLNFFPPPVVLLFVPFVVLPAILWWAIPIGIVVAVIAWWRPAWWSWPILAGAAFVLPTGPLIAVGNSTMWAVAVAALATIWPGAALLLAGKPVLLPFAMPYLAFTPRRSWLAVAVIGGAVSLLFLPAWSDYVLSARNASAGFGLVGTLLYSFPAPLLLLIPLMARVAGTRTWPGSGAAAR